MLTSIYQSLRQIPKGGALITPAISNVSLLYELSIQVCVFKPISLLSCYDAEINYRYLARKGGINYLSKLNYGGIIKHKTFLFYVTMPHFHLSDLRLFVTCGRVE